MVDPPEAEETLKQSRVRDCEPRYNAFVDDDKPQSVLCFRHPLPCKPLCSGEGSSRSGQAGRCRKQDSSWKEAGKTQGERASDSEQPGSTFVDDDKPQNVFRFRQAFPCPPSRTPYTCIS